MIVEYLTQLLETNKDELTSLENQMSKYVQDLQCGQEWIESLQREKKVEDSIFSPRNLNNESAEKLDAARKNVAEINQNLEYTREKMEEQLKKKEEYEKLLQEALIAEQEREKKQIELEVVEPEKYGTPKTGSAGVNKEELLNLLDDLYRQTSLCMGLLSGNKNRCKNEMKEMQKTIRNYTEQIKNI